jgi:DNA-binding HxlR family transcriptional regulator
MKNIKQDSCNFKLMASRDAIEAIQGKWRIPILIALTYGKKRFGEIKKQLPDISPKMLSKELRELETNQLITRSVYDTMPVSIEYSLTPLGKSLYKLLDEVLQWGIHFRKTVIK